MCKRILCWIIFLSGSVFNSFAQQFYDINTVQKIELSFTQSNWDYMLDTAKLGSGGYIQAQWVKVNGVQYNTVGVKYKGNSSYDSSYKKNPLHIRLDKYTTQNYQGYTDIKLANCYGDPSMIREALSYQVLQSYMDCSKSNFAQVYINGSYLGVYTNDENVDTKFCGDHFFSSNNTFVQCNPASVATPTSKSNFKYITTGDSSNYEPYYTMQSKYGWNDLQKLCDTITNYASSLANNIDIDRAIWMLAFDNVMVNLDSYMGVFCQNHYIYKDNTKHFNSIVWDLNMSLGGFAYVGSGASSMGSLTVANMQQLPATIHSTDTYWPLIKDIQANATYKRMYIAHMRTILSEYFSNNNYQTIASQMQNVIDTAVQSDSNKFFTYTQFQNGMTTNYTVGSYTVPGIGNLMSARNSYLQSTSDFTATPPTISAISPSTTSPEYNNILTITANVVNTNTASVYLGYRFDKTQKFTRIQMYDDGIHNDGASNDNVYGVDVTMLGGQMQYYIYAENSSAGMFSPQRAEHEFYILNTTSYPPTLGELVINEFLADNGSIVKDEYSQKDDWIELYNTSNNLLDLSNVYLSDTITNMAKWQFPDSTTLAPNSYLIIWADNDTLQKTFHANFKLNKTSGGKILLSNASNTILDSVSFGTQTTDISYGRFPNGTGSFTTMTPTFNAANSLLNGIKNYTLQSDLKVYPNPANTELIISFSNDADETISIDNLLGQTVAHIKITNNTTTINTSSWQEGIYFIKTTKATHKIIIAH